MSAASTLHTGPGPTASACWPFRACSSWRKPGPCLRQRRRTRRPPRRFRNLTRGRAQYRSPQVAARSRIVRALNTARRTTMTTTNNTSGYVISSDKVEGTTVYNGSGDKLGSIDDLMIDKRTGHIRYAVLEFGGFMGMGTERYPIPWNVLRYDTDKDGYVIPLDKGTLERAPRYRVEEVPVYDNAYGTRIDRYYETH